ncbi:hypothetical protein PoB_005863100 [Plakobranchus ocellatus]|uniref:Uncharacterized protein n=1 Tax=Plakobranchus ocellatus TaxID=259542 RepID=A0AAV4C9X4_9GAST|nr:hypothetical protein PoB_005863100 [Plakobranchus ocellatus]
MVAEGIYFLRQALTPFIGDTINYHGYSDYNNHHHSGGDDNVSEGSDDDEDNESGGDDDVNEDNDEGVMRKPKMAMGEQTSSMKCSQTWAKTSTGEAKEPVENWRRQCVDFGWATRGSPRATF